MDAPPAQTTIKNLTVSVDACETQCVLVKHHDIDQTPALRSRIPGPFVTSHKNLSSIPKGTMIAWPLDDFHRIYLTIDHYITLSVRKIEWIENVKHETIKYRTSYSPVTGEYSVPLKRGVSEQLFIKLIQFTNRFCGKNFLSQCFMSKPKSVKVSMQMDTRVLMEANCSADPITARPQRAKIEMVQDGLPAPVGSTVKTSLWTHILRVVAPPTLGLGLGYVVGKVIGPQAQPEEIPRRVWRHI